MPRIDIHKTYMKMALNIAELSYCERKKVGCIMVKDKAVISCAYNGTVAGSDNSCEIDGVTKKEVIHAELNCVAKVSKSTNSSDGSAMYITLSPCFECAKVMCASGVSNVYYLEIYRDMSGIEFLEQNGIKCEQINLEN